MIAKKQFLSLIIFVFLFALPNIVLAQYVCQCTNKTLPVASCTFCGSACTESGFGAYTGTCRAEDTATYGGNATLPDPLNHITPEELIGKIINAILGIVGSLALVMFVYGGFMWMLSAGNKERVQRGKDILIWATVGLVVIFSAYALVRFVFQAFQG